MGMMANWTGICIEPNPRYWPDLLDRKCTLVAAVAGQSDDEEVKFELTKKGWDCGISEATEKNVGFDNRKSNQGQAFRTVTLQSIFEKVHAPHVIDYLSLDIEGAEMFAFKKFPFHKNKFLKK